jgi:pilus assembly protein CpaF
LPVYVARAQVAAAIQVVVQLSRFSEDGSRRVTRITEVLGLGAEQQYLSRDLFVLRMHGRDAQGRLIGQLEPTGERPSFAAETLEQGLADQIVHSRAIWNLTP